MVTAAQCTRRSIEMQLVLRSPLGSSCYTTSPCRSHWSSCSRPVTWHVRSICLAMETLLVLRSRLGRSCYSTSLCQSGCSTCSCPVPWHVSSIYPVIETRPYLRTVFNYSGAHRLTGLLCRPSLLSQALQKCLYTGATETQNASIQLPLCQIACPLPTHLLTTSHARLSILHNHTLTACPRNGI